MASRVIVKNLPKHATEQRLREHFSAFGEVTDCRLKQTPDGRSRGFGFVGFRRSQEAEEAVKRCNRSFFDTARLSVQLAHAPGADGAARPWSRYTAGSSAFAKLHEGGAGEADAAAGGAPASAPAGAARAAKGKATTKGKAAKKAAKLAAISAAGGASATVGEEVKELSTTERATENRLAFDEGLDDLAYLQRKAKASAAEGEAAAAEEEAGETGGGASSGKPAKRKKGKKAVAVAEAAAGAGAEAAEAPATLGAPGATGDDEEPDVAGRLYVTNFPYGATEDELREHFETIGEVASVQICKDEDTLKSRGFGYVNFVFPECGVRAQAELDMKSFQGRVLRVADAKPKPKPPDPETLKPTLKVKSSYKKKLEERKKKVDAHLRHTWNLLYVSASAAVDAASAQLGVAKGELMGKDAENAALTAALTETSVIQQTKQWLQKEGIRVEAFEQSGASLASSKAVAGDGKLRDDTFIVKHLPAGASASELRERFARYGELVRCSLAPSGTVAIAQYTDKSHAQRAFQKLAFSRYRHVPLYLEWAPADCFEEGRDQPSASDEARGGATGSGAPATGAEEDDEDRVRGCLFVKNLNFATTDEALRSAFSGCQGFRSATVMKKKAAVLKGAAAAANNRSLSMGYGFVEFATPEQATEALKRRQGVVVDDHALQLQISQRHRPQVGQAADTGVKAKTAIKTQKLCVRNLAFEVTVKELRQLFGAYGSVTAARLPKKADYTGHRGFAFIDFASKSEAAAAYEALQHTHLYGRRLVIEPAEETQTDVGAVQETAQKRQAAKEQQSEAKRRRRAGVLNAPGEAGSFEDAFMS
mmetsp:Transcript_36619/g.105353  ORF Transcript_36619/g.105353 Transcript_36619/m.105353 type:complete len:821 (-) Transcript_36619:42-2504(-)